MKLDLCLSNRKYSDTLTYASLHNSCEVIIIITIIIIINELIMAV